VAVAPVLAPALAFMLGPATGPPVPEDEQPATAAAHASTPNAPRARRADPTDTRCITMPPM
jgi:hypothetical protein